MSEGWLQRTESAHRTSSLHHLRLRGIGWYRRLHRSRRRRTTVNRINPTMPTSPSPQANGGMGMYILLGESQRRWSSGLGRVKWTGPSWRSWWRHSSRINVCVARVTQSTQRSLPRKFESPLLTLFTYGTGLIPRKQKSWEATSLCCFDDDRSRQPCYIYIYTSKYCPKSSLVNIGHEV